MDQQSPVRWVSRGWMRAEGCRPVLRWAVRNSGKITLLRALHFGRCRRCYADTQGAVVFVDISFSSLKGKPKKSLYNRTYPPVLRSLLPRGSPDPLRRTGSMPWRCDIAGVRVDITIRKRYICMQGTWGTFDHGWEPSFQPEGGVSSANPRSGTLAGTQQVLIYLAWPHGFWGSFTNITSSSLVIGGLLRQPT